jgi:hypothetical protein
VVQPMNHHAVTMGGYGSGRAPSVIVLEEVANL